MGKINIFWFRRDLRLNDNHGMFKALSSKNPVLPIFIFDTEILNKLENKNDSRVNFIHNEVKELKRELQDLGSDLLVMHCSPKEAFKKLLDEYSIEVVFTNEDYEPYAIKRDQFINEILSDDGILFKKFADHLIIPPGKVLKKDGNPYTVFTPFKREWFRVNQANENKFFDSFPSEKFHHNFLKDIEFRIPSLQEIGFKESSIDFPPKQVSQGLIKAYGEKRNFPGIVSTSRLGVHFRFGTISIREKARKAQKLSETYLNELIWRDFYAHILFHFPHVVKQSFRAKYDQIEWLNNEDDFKSWCNGKTGYKIVDAGMRELNETGFMHNRVRMITASFLTKHLLIDWRWGEAYFAEKLLDFELASNNGGWQWASGSGTDAAPYFRIFNPYTQLEKFDKNLKYVNKWVPEHNSPEYPKEIVEHKFARQRCLEVYQKALNDA